MLRHVQFTQDTQHVCKEDMVIQEPLSKHDACEILAAKVMTQGNRLADYRSPDQKVSVALPYSIVMVGNFNCEASVRQS